MLEITLIKHFTDQVISPYSFSSLNPLENPLGDLNSILLCLHNHLHPFLIPGAMNKTRDLGQMSLQTQNIYVFFSSSRFFWIQIFTVSAYVCSFIHYPTVYPCKPVHCVLQAHVILSFSVCVSRCVWGVCMDAHSCVCMKKLEEEIRCPALITLHFIPCSVRDQEPDGQAPSILLSPLTQHWGYRHAWLYPVHLCCTCLFIWTWT